MSKHVLANVARTSNISRWRSCAARSSRGQSDVELALLLPVLVLILLGTIDFGRLFWMYESVLNAAHEGALYGAHNPCDTAGIQSQVTSQDTSLGISTGSISVAWYDPSGTTIATCDSTVPTVSSNQRDTIEVKITNYPFKPITPVISNIIGSTFNINVKVRAGVLA